MGGWDRSRHPEWDLMYKAGLTVREIADRCHQPRSTVHRHLQVRERHDPGLRSRHENARASRSGDGPTPGWRRRAQEIQDFYSAYQRLPHRDGKEYEKALYTWIKRQRLASQHGNLSTAKIVLLSAIPGWDIETRQQALDQQWRVRLDQFKDYVDATGQLPRYKKHATEDEHSLGVWLHTQHQRRAERELPLWRQQALDAVFPEWHSRA